MADIKSRLGYIMSLLGVTGKTLALEVGIDMTTVSKWKNGQRKLKTRSKHAEKLAEYFLSESFTYQRNQILTLLTSSDFETTCMDDNELVKALALWMTEDTTLYPTLENATEDKEDAEVMIRIYKGYDGWKEAMEVFWGKIISLPAGQHIYLGDFGDIEWDLVDSNMMKYMIDNMLKVISLGHKITIIDYMTNTYKPYVVILRWLQVYLSPNVEVRYIYKQEEAYFNEAIYVVEGHMAVVGMNIEKSHGDHVTMIHQDETSSMFFEKAIKVFYDRSHQLIEVTGLKDPSNILKVMADHFKEKQTTYMINPMPTFRNMPIDLLKRILDDNDVPPYIQEMCLEANRKRRELRNRCRYVQIYNLDALEAAVAKPFVIDYDLSIIVGKEIKIKQHLFREHLEYLTTISNSDHYTMVLVSFDNLKLNVDQSSICVQDDSIVIAWHPEKFERAIYCKELTVIGEYFHYLKEIWHQIPPISKSDPWRQKQLSRLLDH
jgi:transcriptional regulator with XRE-family HTH domain